MKERNVEFAIVDIDPRELALNKSGANRYQADICNAEQELPTDFDLALIRSGFEHFHDNAAALSNIGRMLRSGGRALFVFPDRNANFALLNRLLPNRVSAALLRELLPDSEGVQGFLAHYDRCTYKDFTKAAKAAGFTVIEHYPAFYSFSYFSFFPPLHVVSLTLDTLRFVIGWKALATYHFFLVQREVNGLFDIKLMRRETGLAK